MKFDGHKKAAITQYILEKIETADPDLSKTISEAFSINRNTVHTYINELIKKGIITRIKRGKYDLVRKEYLYSLSRSQGHLDTDTYAYDHCLYQHIDTFASNIQAIWNYTLSEMMNNVMDHSLAEHVTLTLETDYLHTTVSIQDDGIGIFKKIKEYFGFVSLDDAISELFKGKLTTDSVNHSGEGIFFSSKMMDTFYVISDKKVFTLNKYDNARIMNLTASDMNGTCVIMSLSNHSHKTPQEIFDLYADVDSGFTRTLIPLKNIFSVSPVSRSQAKRVCNRLENFEEVIIDFEEIEWMGQGFAHQLFHVFSNKHPEITLTPINMNESVAKMYKHVNPSRNSF